MVTILSLSNNSILFAQEDNVEIKNPISISCDLMSRYVWRGTDFGGSPSIQPGIEYSKAGFSIGAWGAYAISSAQMKFSGAECSGAAGNHSDPGTAGNANADQAAAY